MIPLEKFTIHSSRNPERVRETLLTVVEPRPWWRWNSRNPAADQPYQGEIGDRAFQISRIISWDNCFLPVINGRITPEDMGSKIEISMSLHPVSFIFLLVWLGTNGNICISAAIDAFSEEKFEPIALIVALITLGMFLSGFLLVFIGFKPEAAKAKKFLRELLEN